MKNQSVEGKEVKNGESQSPSISDSLLLSLHHRPRIPAYDRSVEPCE